MYQDRSQKISQISLGCLQSVVKPCDRLGRIGVMPEKIASAAKPTDVKPKNVIRILILTL
jgi:hypothetical protein